MAKALIEGESTCKELNLVDTLDFLRKIGSKRIFRIQSKFPNINGIECEMEKGERCFSFSCAPLDRRVSPIEYQSEGYGFGDPFELVNDEDEKIEIKKGIGAISLKVGQALASTGEFWEIESNFVGYACYHRAIIASTGSYSAPIEFIKSVPFTTGKSRHMAGFIGLELKEYKIGIFDYSVEKDKYVFIDCYSKITQIDFQNLLHAIIYPYALISGCLIRDEIFIFQSDDSSFQKISGYQFNRLEKSQKGLSAIDPKMCKEFFKEEVTTYLPIDNFQRIIQQSLEDVRFLRAIKIIAESFGYPLEIRAATCSVALETLKNIILEKNSEKINPFKSKSDAKKLISELKKMINSSEDSIFNNKAVVLAKVENLNQVTNSDGFILAFKLLEIPLDANEIECINMRNDFLHGRIPFENEKSLSEYKLHRITFKLQYLVTALIFKMIGYNGYLLNNIKMLDVLRYKVTDSDGSLFIKL